MSVAEAAERWSPLVRAAIYPDAFTSRRSDHRSAELSEHTSGQDPLAKSSASTRHAATRYNAGDNLCHSRFLSPGQSVGVEEDLLSSDKCQRPYGSSRTRSRSRRSAPYPARNSVPDAGLSDVLTPGRQGVFLRLYSSTAGASRTASLAFCSSESGGARWASLRRYSSRRCLYLSSRCCPASVISRLAIRSPAPGRSRPAGSSMKKQTRIPRSRCTSGRTGAVLRRRAGRQRTAASLRLRPSAIHLGVASGPGTGLTAQFRRLAGQRLVQLALGRVLRDPARLGPQASPATGELAQRSHRGGLLENADAGQRLEVSAAAWRTEVPGCNRERAGAIPIAPAQAGQWPGRVGGWTWTRH